MMVATTREWSVGFARQAAADFATFDLIKGLGVPDCHKLQFLQMSCEKLVKAHLYGVNNLPDSIQSSHAHISKHLPKILQYEAMSLRFSVPLARLVLGRAKHLAREIELLAPSVKADGQRPDNCEYPWEDNAGSLHVHLDWSFNPSQLITSHSGRTILKLIKGSIERLLLSQ
jgi:hypothetical protein